MVKCIVGGLLFHHNRRNPIKAVNSPPPLFQPQLHIKLPVWIPPKSVVLVTALPAVLYVFSIAAVFVDTAAHTDGISAISKTEMID